MARRKEGDGAAERGGAFQLGGERSFGGGYDPRQKAPSAQFCKEVAVQPAEVTGLWYGSLNELSRDLHY